MHAISEHAMADIAGDIEDVVRGLKQDRDTWREVAGQYRYCAALPAAERR